mmetsp:Transcript_28501/g.62690  ORF Transcript_28501/g.62690 Transcript_28501/m.62690 type:complete len:334 (-) Transcript_28501:69-1070(-)
MTLPHWLKKSNGDDAPQEAQEGAPDAHVSSSEQSEPPPRINHKNILNLLFFIINIVFTYGIGTEGWLGNGTNGELSEKYQTIITPSSRAFIIWAVIFVFQAIFCIAQFFKRFRAHPQVQKGMSYWYCGVCAFQVGWTLSFSYEIIALSLAMMLLILFCLYGLLYSQYYAESDGSLFEFWLLRFPFAIHAGWITAASALNTSVVAVWQQASAPIQLGLGIVSLAVLHAVSVWVLFNLKKGPNYTIASVLSWANGWIYYELQNPKALITDTFSADAIQGVAYAAIAVAFIIVTQIVVRLGMSAVAKCRGRKGDEAEPESEEQDDVGEDGMYDAKV